MLREEHGSETARPYEPMKVTLPIRKGVYEKEMRGRNGQERKDVTIRKEWLQKKGWKDQTRVIAKNDENVILGRKKITEKIYGSIFLLKYSKIKQEN